MKCALKLLVLFLMGMVLPAHAGFSDVDSSYFGAAAIQTLAEQQVISGYSDGSFRPHTPINRAEWAKLLTVAFPQNLSLTGEGAFFSDVEEGAWHAPYIAALQRKQVVQGYPDGTFRPSAMVTRAEAIKMLLLASGKTEVQISADYGMALQQNIHVSLFFSDAQDGQWFAPYLYVAFAEEVLKGAQVNGRVYAYPTAPMTRGEAAELLFRVRQKISPVVPVSPQELPVVPVTPLPPVVTPPVDPWATTAAEKASFDATGVWQGRHIAIRLHLTTAKKLNNPKLFVEKLDRVYEFYAQLVDGVPYNGDIITIQERCSAANPPQDLSTCPNGIMSYRFEGNPPGDAWGLAGNPVQILSAGMESTVALFNTQGAMPLGMAHELGHDFDQVASKPQYMFHTASVEAWANLKAMYAIDAAGLPMELGGKVYTTTKDLIDGFYRPFLKSYQDNQYTFESLISEGSRAGNLTDYYISVLLPLIDLTGHEALFDTIKFYKRNETSLQTIGNTTLDDKQRRFAQFLLIWSCKSGKDLAVQLQPYRFDITPARSQRIAQCTQAGSSADSYILSLDAQL